MSKSLQAIRGMNDILPEQTPLWRYFEGTVASLLDGYGYRQIRMPIVEFTELFKRSIGEVTDIVEKEMYTFDDRNGDSLTLRQKALRRAYVRCLSMACPAAVKRRSFGTSVRCFVTSVRRKAVIASSTRLVWKYSISTARTSMPS